MLHQAGLFLGHELLGAHPSNPHGHFEDVEVMNLHEQILSDNGQNLFVESPFSPVIGNKRWHRMCEIREKRNAEHALWGFKEPRTSLFIMAWKHLLPESKVLIVYRHFAETTYSLARRHSTEMFLGRGSALNRQLWEVPDLALRSWLTYNEALLRFARLYPADTMVVSFDEIRDGFPLIPAINRQWTLNLADRPGKAIDSAVSDTPSPRQPVADRALIPQAEETWQELEKLGSRSETLIEKMYG